MKLNDEDLEHPFQCPFCGHEMTPGNLQIRGTGCGFMLFGLSYLHCWFLPDEGDRQIFVSHRLGPKAYLPGSSASPIAFRCPACFTVISPGDEDVIAREREKNS